MDTITWEELRETSRKEKQEAEAGLRCRGCWEALLPEDSTAVMDADFAKDVEAAIESHREPLEPPSWD